MEKNTLSLEEQLVARLISLGWHISCAESCTGGLLAATIINAANASRVLDASFVTYAIEAKMRYAHVAKATLDAYGVVSEQVAEELAVGAARETSAEVGVGITGLAGPGGSDGIPAGTVCFGFSVGGAITSQTMHFGEIGRNEVRREAVQFALSTLLHLLPTEIQN